MGTKELRFYDYEIIEEAGTKYIYATHNTGLFEIDDRTFIFLQQQGKTLKEARNTVKDLFTEEELDELIQDMIDNQFIKTEANDELILAQSTLQAGCFIQSITLFLAQECNLRCTYCYAEDGEYDDRGLISYETACKAVDFLIESSGEYKDLHITFFGGEPLISFPIIKELVGYIRDKEMETGKKISLGMTTNGTLITEEIEKFLIDNQISVQVSIDGDKETQNANRFYANKKGCYDTVIKNTASMREKNLLNARATLTSKQMNKRHTFYHLDSLGFRKIAISPAYNLLSEDDYETFMDEETKYLEELESLIKQRKFDVAMKMVIPMSELHRIHNGDVRILPCGVGRTMYAVDIHGDVYPCQRFVSSKQYKLGNIYSGAEKRDAFLKEIEISNHEKCANCWARNLCVGGCPHENLSATGNTNASDEKVCKATRRKYKELLRLYIRLTEEEKDILFSRVPVNENK